MMSSWFSGIEDMDLSLFNEFSESIKLSNDTEVFGIFDNESERSRLASGGFSENTLPILYLLDADALTVESRHQLTIRNTRFSVVYPPEPDGTGLTKLILSKYDGKQQSVTDIRY